MKIMQFFSYIFFTCTSVVLSNEYSLNFFDDSNKPNNAYGFISKTYSEAYAFLTHSGYHYKNTLDSFLVISPAASTNFDSIAYLISQKDGYFAESSHNKYLPQFFIFNMDSVYPKLGSDSTVAVVLKWKGEMSPVSLCAGRFSIKIPQAGHGWTPKSDTSGNSLKVDRSDTSFALNPSWFRRNSFFSHELVIEPIITNTTDSATTLKTDFIEVVLITSGKTEIPVHPFTIIHNTNDLSVSRPGSGPFNIQYTLKEKSYITLDIFSVSGTFVNRLDKGIKPAGKHSIVWDGFSKKGSSLSGNFILRLDDNKNINAAPLVLIE